MFFDLIHVGHVELLRWAKQQGTYLVVGLNSDQSVRRLKGPGRPVVPQDQRATILQAIRYVDRVIIFEEDTPGRLIHWLRPDVLVKGPDYAGRDVQGREFVEASGGVVRIPDWPITVSSSHLMRRASAALEGQS